MILTLYWRKLELVSEWFFQKLIQIAVLDRINKYLFPIPLLSNFLKQNTFDKFAEKKLKEIKYRKDRPNFLQGHSCKP